MINLFIDTSSSDVSIAVAKDEIILSSITKEVPNEHSVYTTSFLDDVIKKAKIKPTDIERIMVVVGPGSFTGVRIGVTIAKVYAYLLNLGVICVSSLKMRSISIAHNYCLSLIDARHNNFYAGLYDNENNEVIKEGFFNIDEIMKFIEEYNPTIVSDKDLEIEDIKVQKGKIDFSKIISYYENATSVNCHLVKPNYLKKPQVLEELG